ncbi:MAG: nucleotide-binding protein [Desulfotignum sp.]|nr:nucleotide-binding protein [Desulfotignum sp.]MCF8112343.1 nucleotide-binding protein [Desulfotignum sp.]MCF8124619.1 nucleotide-binding protein [Desulfotignum sp.]
MNQTLKQDIETLVRLQKIETEIFRLQSVIEKVEKEKITLASRLREFETALNDEKQNLSEIQQKCTDAENEIKVVDQRIIKSNETLRMVKTNKEYQVLLREVDDNKKRKDILESQLLDFYDLREASEVRVSESEHQFVLLKEQIKAEQLEIDKKTVDDKELLHDLLEQQKEIGQSLDPALMTRFRKISKMNRGQAVAQVRNESCMGCFMNVPPQLCIEVQRANQLISCPQCSRILYHVDE